MAAIVTLLNLIYGLYQVPESYPVQDRRPFKGHYFNPFRSLKLLTQHRTIIYLAAVLFCTDLGLQCFVSTWVLFTSYKFAWSAFESGISLTLLGLSVAIVQSQVIHPLIIRFGEQATIQIGLVASMVGYLLYMLVDQEWLLYGAIFLNGFDFLVKPTAQGFLSSKISAADQGAVQGALASQTALAAILAPLFATALFRYSISIASPFPEAVFGLGIFLFSISFLLVRKINQYDFV
jgi:DHA1 family tetracycline resistance protein-like MFS transporter